MIKKIIYITFIFLPLLVFGVHAEQASGVQGAATVASNFINDIWDFFDKDVPEFFERALAYIIKQVVLFKINAQIESMKLAWSISKEVLESFQIGSKIASTANALPQDVKAALVDLRFFDALNIIAQAFIARYVLRFL